jgi:signal transduction histidine kinase
MWLFPLVVAAGSALLATHTGWMFLPAAGLAYLAGRKLAALAPAVGVFAAVAVAGFVIAVVRDPDPLAYGASIAFAEFLAAVLPWWAGRYQRLNAEQRHREHAVVADQARLRERARIAQDMHDSLGHELALIALHGGALELGRDLTGEQRRSAGALREHAMRATDRLHDLVWVLGSSEAAVDRQPVAQSLDDLVRQAAEAGLPVRLEQRGPAPDWAPLTSQAAHRVVREALTNAARHAPGAAVTVTVDHHDPDTRIEVVNGPSASVHRAGSGQGLIGLDERVRLCGGTLTAGSFEGGWRVAARLPLSGPPRPPGDFDVTVSRRITRRRLALTAALPLAVVVALVAAMVLAQAVTVARTGLARDRYHGLHVGEPEQQVRAVLPPRGAAGPMRLIAEAPPPAGARCDYFHAGSSITDTAPRVYRLCFAGGVLVAKSRFERG